MNFLWIVAIANLGALSGLPYCPGEILVTDSGLVLEAGTTDSSATPHRFSFPFVTAGRPQYKMEIVTTQYSQDDEEITEWDVTSGEMWVECRYMDTRATIVRKIEAGLGMCRRIYSKRSKSFSFICGNGTKQSR